jgi:hypothetical protein
VPIDDDDNGGGDDDDGDDDDDDDQKRWIIVGIRLLTKLTTRDFSWLPLTPIDTAMQRYDANAMDYITGIWNVNTVKRRNHNLGSVIWRVLVRHLLTTSKVAEFRVLLFTSEHKFSTIVILRAFSRPYLTVRPKLVNITLHFFLHVEMHVGRDLYSSAL